VDNIHLIELHEDVSASEIRSRLKAGKAVGSLLPKAIETYIKRKGLYQ
jgi:nicotinic acid mononucleotide adenylyltransferase